MPQVKICGLTSREDADVAEAAGASYLGVILAGGPRLLSVPQAQHVLGQRRHGVQRVAVFGDRPVKELLAMSDQLDLDVIQLHGNPSPDLVQKLRGASGRAVWPVLRVEGTLIPHYAMDLADAAGALLLDAKVVGVLGGTGVTLDWIGLEQSVAALRADRPALRIVLAGGLTPVNVARAIGLLNPDVVDVSSGIETAPGTKDPAAIQRFVSAVWAVREINA